MDFWGMTSRLREMSFIWSRVTGLMRKATSALPLPSCCRANGLLVEAEELFEDDLVELSDVELLLARGEAGE